MKLSPRSASLLARLLVLAVALGTVAGCGRFQARQMIRKGNEHFKAQQYEDALKYFQDAKKLDPGEMRLNKFVGYAAMALYQPGSTHDKDLEYATLAIDSFKKYLATEPKDQEKVQQFLMTMYMNSGQLDQAIAFFKQYMNTHPNDEQAVQSIAMLYAKKADYESTVSWQEKRIEMLKKSTTMQPEELKQRLSEAYYTLGVTSWQKSYDSNEVMLDLPARIKVLDRGMSALKKAIEVRPGYSDAMAYVNLILRQYAKYEVDEAKKAAYTAEADSWLKQAVAAREAEKARERVQQANENVLEAL
jgi:tetratricopeptide (TPR) repeat protein